MELFLPDQTSSQKAVSQLNGLPGFMSVRLYTPTVAIRNDPGLMGAQHSFDDDEYFIKVMENLQSVENAMLELKCRPSPYARLNEEDICRLCQRSGCQISCTCETMYHLDCLASHFTIQTEEIIPTMGECLDCSHIMSWDTIIRSLKSEAMAREEDEDEDSSEYEMPSQSTLNAGSTLLR